MSDMLIVVRPTVLCPSCHPRHGGEPTVFALPAEMVCRSCLHSDVEHPRDEFWEGPCVECDCPQMEGP